MRRLLLLAAVVLGPAAPASAQWGETAPVVLSPDDVATCLRDAGGGRVASLAVDGKRYGAALSAVTPDGLAPDGAAVLGRLGACPAVAVADSGAAVVAGVVSRLRPPRTRLLAAVREPGGEFGAPVEVTVARGFPVSMLPEVAVASDGSAAVAWMQTRFRFGRDPAPGTLRVVRRAPGGAFGAVETLASRMRGDVFGGRHALAVDARGALTVAWARPRPSRGDVEELNAVDVVCAEPGRRFGTPQRLADEVQYVSRVALAQAADGRALLAHDGDEQVRVYERAPGDTAFTAVGGSGGDPDIPSGARDPAVALAADGGAVVAWADGYGEGVQAISRPGPGTFGPAERLRRADQAGRSQSVVFGASGGPPYDEEGNLVRAVAAPGGRAAVAWVQDAVRFGDPSSARIAVRTPTGFAPPAVLGGPVRDVGGIVPWLGTADPAAVWADNRTVVQLEDYPVGSGRLHLSLPGRAPADPAPPSVTLSARPQALYHDGRLVVDARCSAACDLRAVIRPRGRSQVTGLPRGGAAGTAGRSTAGAVRLRLDGGYTHIAPRGGGTVRVVVRATAPGGRAVRTTAVRVRVRRRTPPPFQRPLDVRAHRAGDDVVVTWRTAAPARRMSFSVFGRRTRGKTIPRTGGLPPFATREGHGKRRFRVRLTGARRSRWVVLTAASKDPPGRVAREVVPIG